MELLQHTVMLTSTDHRTNEGVQARSSDLRIKKHGYQDTATIRLLILCCLQGMDYTFMLNEGRTDTRCMRGVSSHNTVEGFEYCASTSCYATVLSC